MITKAKGTKISTRIRTAASIRTISRWSRIACHTSPPKRTIVMTAPAVRNSSSGTTTARNLPGSVSWSQVRATALTRAPPRSLVHPAHHGIQAGHDRHGVGEEVARQELGHGAQMDEARVMDLE